MKLQPGHAAVGLAGLPLGVSEQQALTLEDGIPGDEILLSKLPLRPVVQPAHSLAPVNEMVNSEDSRV